MSQARAADTPDAGQAQLTQLLADGDLLVLTGAGVSTASGIPDYRGPGTRARARNPIQYRDFLRSHEARARYWARSVLGYPRVRQAQPNQAHTTLVQLARAGLLTGLLTQNVDGLHARAQHGPHVELHGALREVICIQCGLVSCRDRLQQQLLQQNPWLTDQQRAPAPDGDSELTDPRVLDMSLISCAACDGPLKPHVVFFGEGVPKPRVEAAFELLSRARALLVLGSSLAVFSGLRFVRAAHKQGLPVGIVTYGPTRGDALATFTLDADVGASLQRALAALR
jgi:NAD-dependent deacetylase sirtuin 4